jgi:hypothetical protein
MRSLRFGAWMLLIPLSIMGCTRSGDVEASDASASPSVSPARTAAEEPCPDGVTLALGAPFFGRDYAKFQAAGGTVYVNVGRFTADRSEAPDGGAATIYVGALARPPTYDPQARRLRGTLLTAPVVGDTWSAFELSEGRYWLTAANGWDVVIRSCEADGVVDARSLAD